MYLVGDGPRAVSQERRRAYSRSAGLHCEPGKRLQAERAEADGGRCNRPGGAAGDRTGAAPTCLRARRIDQRQLRGATPKSGQTLSSAQIAGLDAHQKAAYHTYVSALTRADADQTRVQADLAAVNLNAARLQNYASDPHYGTIAVEAVSAVNARL